MKFLHLNLKRRSHTPEAVHSTDARHEEPQGYLHPNFRHWSYFHPSNGEKPDNH